MRIAVCVAAVPNPEKVKWDRFRQLLDLQEAEAQLNPADRNALELAAQLAQTTGSSFDAFSAGPDASSALREAAAFGAARLVAIADAALETADAAGIAAALAAAIGKSGGADIVMCGAATSSYGSGALPGYLSAFLNAGLHADVVAIESTADTLTITGITGSALVRTRASMPLVVAVASYGIAIRSISPILLMRASKKQIETIRLVEAGASLPLPTTGATDGPLESNRKKRANELVDGPDPAARAITLVSALRERRLV